MFKANAVSLIVISASSRAEFRYATPSRSGLMLRGEPRHIKAVKKAGGGSYLVAAMNNESLYIFEKARKTIGD